MKLACNAFRRPRSWDKRNFRIILGRKICSGRRVQVSISPTRAEGYPFVKRYPYRMLRRATWLKAASCVPPILPPPLSFFLFSFFLPSSFSPRSTSNIWCDTRENIPSQRNWLAFLRKWGKGEGKREREENSTFPGIPTEFLSSSPVMNPRVSLPCLFVVRFRSMIDDDDEKSYAHSVRWSIICFVFSGKMNLNEISIAS